MIHGPVSGAFPPGYTSITEIDGPHANMLLDFGVLVLDAGETWTTSHPERETAVMLLTGEGEFTLEAAAGAPGAAAPPPAAIARHAPLEEASWTAHVPGGASIHVRATAPCEFIVERAVNPTPFDGRIITPDEVRSQRFGEGVMQGTSTRVVRTVFDAASHAESAMVLGEVINAPGRWSSYPPHTHAHPEIYHYRFFPEHGFGFSQVGDHIHRVTHGDTVAIPGGVPHPQVAAPGYAMFYVWMIPHLSGNRFGPDSRIFDPEHYWVTEPAAPIWDPSESGEATLR